MIGKSSKGKDLQNVISANKHGNAKHTSGQKNKHQSWGSQLHQNVPEVNPQGKRKIAKWSTHYIFPKLKQNIRISLNTFSYSNMMLEPS